MMPPTSIDGTDITGATIDGNYQNVTPNMSISTSTVFEGSHSLAITGKEGLNYMYSVPGDGLPNYPSKGTQWEFYVNLNGTSGQLGFFFGVGSSGGNAYFIQPLGRGMEIRKNSFSTIASNNVAPPSSGWFRNVITWDDGTLGGSNNDITYEMFDTSGSSLGSITANDNEHASKSGIGFTSSGPSGLSTNFFVDSVKIVS